MFKHWEILNYFCEKFLKFEIFEKFSIKLKEKREKKITSKEEILKNNLDADSDEWYFLNNCNKFTDLFIKAFEKKLKEILN